MEFVKGQVFSLGRLTEHLKNSKEKKLKEKILKDNLTFFTQTKEEIKTLHSTLNNTCDKESIESSIYRLKAAELELNRFLRQAKESQIKS